MNLRKLARFTSIFLKKAQTLPTAVSSTNTISSDETSAFLEHSQMTVQTSNEVYEWAEGQVGEPGTETEQGKINTVTYSRDMRDSSTNFNAKAKEFIDSTDGNKAVSSIESLFNTMMQSYNNLTGQDQLNSQWVSDNQQFDLAQKIKQMEGSMKYIGDYIKKQKNVETNTENQPQLPS
jgi:hypothetical protein